ncbi:MAG: M36 family metallopeptidase [Solirubrobacteraceae bacterium]
MRNRHAVALVLGALVLLPASAGAVTRSPATGPAAAKPYLDSRAADRSRAARAGTPVAAVRPSAATRQARTALRSRLGREGVLSIDPLTGTPRQLLRTDGALSSPRGGDRAGIARDVVRANRDALGLDAADVGGLSPQRRVTGTHGLIVVHFRQLYRGIPAFDNDVRVAIDRAGRVLSVAGSPRHDLAAASIEPGLSGAEALARLQQNVGVERSLPVASGPAGARRTTTFKGGDFARLVLFGAAGGAKLAWHVTYRATSTALYDAVVDASSGAVLYRQNLTKAAAAANVYPNHPGASATQAVDLEGYGLTPGATVLDGTFSRQWADVDDDDVPDAAEETHPSGGTDYLYPFTPFTPGASCTSARPCAWDPAARTSWQANRGQNGVQAFYLVSRFHDHLAGPDVGFTDADGNFEKGGTGGGDPVLTQTDDGADTEGDGGPDVNHENNANMSTPPDGQSPTMQMYLFEDSGSPDALDFRSMNGGDDSGVVWHEYTHGLSNRLVTNADGSGALSAAHARSMGEGWSDWYASDFQVRDGLKSDTLATPGQIDVGDYSDLDPHALRTQALDCPVGIVDTRCPGGAVTGVGGYTLGDFGKVAGAPEVHADGEIWSEALWDLRQALQVKTGSADAAAGRAESLVTEGMRLSPPEPTMLDMRNAILAAEQAILGGTGHDLVWDVFRKRGMGYYAAASDGADTNPVEDFMAPPNPSGPKGSVTGVVTDSDTGLPISGVRVGFGGHASGPGFAENFADTTDASGRYTIEGVPTGSYPKLAFFASAGYDAGVAPNVSISADTTTTRDIRMTRDWAALNGGAVVRQVSDNTADPFGCGVDKALDLSQGTAWSAFNPSSPDPGNPHAGSPTMVVELPRPIDISAFLIDPSAGCGDGASSTTREYTVETSGDGTTFRTAVDGRGAAGFTDGDIGLLNRRNPAGTTGKNVRFVRLRMLSPLRQGDDCLPTACTGTDFIDLTEFKVLGGRPNTLPAGSLAVSNANPTAGEVITFDARSFTDADSAIAGYDWDFNHDGTVDRTTDTPTTDFAYATAGSYTATVAAKDFRGGAGNASTGVTVAPPASGPPGPPGPPGTPPALGPVPSLTLPAHGTRGWIRPSVRCALRCSVRAKLVVSKATARRLHLRKRTLATLTRTLTRTTRTRLRLRVPAKVRAAMRRRGAKSIRATLTITARHIGGRGKTAHRVVRIRL